jgi:hypothetical protein
MSEPNPWHRIGVIMSLLSLVVTIYALVLIVAATQPGFPMMWQSTTRHSDTPSQVQVGIRGLESEIGDHAREIEWRIAELQAVHLRALTKAAECRAGRGEEGETVDDAKRAELAARAPEWDRVASDAEAALARLTGKP